MNDALAPTPIYRTAADPSPFLPLYILRKRILLSAPETLGF